MSKLVRLEKIKFPNTISQLSNFDMSAEYFVVKQASYPCIDVSRLYSVLGDTDNIDPPRPIIIKALG